MNMKFKNLNVRKVSRVFIVIFSICLILGITIVANNTKPRVQTTKSLSYSENPNKGTTTIYTFVSTTASSATTTKETTTTLTTTNAITNTTSTIESDTTVKPTVVTTTVAPTTTTAVFCTETEKITEPIEVPTEPATEAPTIAPVAPPANITYSSDADLGDTSTVEGRKQAIWNYFINKGYSASLTAGIMGNIAIEDNTFHPNMCGGGRLGSLVTVSSGQGYGICQWTNRYGHAALYNWCLAHGYSPDSLIGQLEYINAGLQGIDLHCAVNTKDPGGFGHSGAGVLDYTYNQIRNNVGSFEYLNSLSVVDATGMFLKWYERPGSSYSYQLGLRSPQAQNIYNTFAS